MPSDTIQVINARENNLKSISVSIPKNKITVFTGVSGSGKSSLVFDIIHKESQRRYIESMSTYVRQMVNIESVPNVEAVEGLSPSIAVNQHKQGISSKSTVATLTDIYDYMRLLFTKIGKNKTEPQEQHSIHCTEEGIVQYIASMPQDSRVHIMSPVQVSTQKDYQQAIKDIIQKGFIRAEINGKIYDDIEEAPKNKLTSKNTIYVIVDRVIIKPEVEKRLGSSIDSAKHINQNAIVVRNISQTNSPGNTLDNLTTYTISKEEYQDIPLSTLSFYSPTGTCPSCLGSGVKLTFNADLIVPDKSKSLMDGALHPWQEGNIKPEFKKETTLMLQALSRKYSFNLNAPWNKLHQTIQNIILNGSDEDIEVVQYHKDKKQTKTTKFPGVLSYMEDNPRQHNQSISQYKQHSNCPECNGFRLRKESLELTINDTHIGHAHKLTVPEAYRFYSDLETKLNPRERMISGRIVHEIKKRLQSLIDMGMDYVNLDRSVASLSGGEFQRIKLCSQIGIGLTGITYILDEPSIGLHRLETHKLIEMCKTLRDMGNTLLIVEHDQDIIKAADHIVDIGIGAGKDGGSVVATGTANDIINCPSSITGRFLSRKPSTQVNRPVNEKQATKNYITISNATINNLNNLNVSIPLNHITCITGVSGSGKSTLAIRALYQTALQKMKQSTENIQKCAEVSGLEYINKIVAIDQSPIHTNTRSNLSTYIGIFETIRELFACLTDAKMLGIEASHFSFNTAGGRCDKCNGHGSIKIEMGFMPDMEMRCDKCHGSRYNKKVLSVLYGGMSIADILAMTVNEAINFFAKIADIVKKLQIIQEVGLGYISIGQTLSSFSGGELQRLKIAKELSKGIKGQNLYILDEPTTGLHPQDVDRLISAMHALISKGNTIVAIEHNLDIIINADLIIEMGPGGGVNGGNIIAQGSVQEIMENQKSITGPYIKKYTQPQ